LTLAPKKAALPVVKPEVTLISKHKIPSHPRYVRFLRTFIFQLALDMNFGYHDAASIKAAFTEAANNIIQHAYDGDFTLPIIIEIHRFSDRIEIYLRDFGRKVARSQIKSRALKDYRESGLGVYMMERMMDYINFDTTLEKGTLLKMVKRI